MRLSAIILPALLLHGCTPPTARPAERGSDLTEQVRGLVAVQGTAELNAWSAADDGVTAENVQIVSKQALEGGATLWHAVLPLHHFHPFTVLQKGGETVRLGGFQNPEVERAAALLALRPRDGKAALEAARTLALLADPNGAERYVVLGSPAADDAAVVDSWRASKPRALRPDTAFQLRDRGWVSRVTVLSQQTRSYGQAWQPYTYSFFFSPDGDLTSWFVRTGPTFQLGNTVGENVGAATPPEVGGSTGSKQ